MRYFFLLLYTLFLSAFSATAGGLKIPSTYFSYLPEELDALRDCTSEKKMSIEEVKKWDERIPTLVKNCQLGSTRYRLKAYLYTAQRDAAVLSCHYHGETVGSLDPISYEVLKLFCDNIPEIDAPDTYSQLLTDIVMKKILSRFKMESEELRDYPVSRGDARLKDVLKPPGGLQTASWKPWILENPTKILLPEPPKRDDPFWKEQAKLVLQASQDTTEQEKKAVVYWQEKDWDMIVTDHMEKKSLPLLKILFIRSLFAESGSDADIVIYFNKYTYLTPRPWIINADIKPLIDKPHHPSYPSSHSVIAGLYAVLLTRFFPSDEETWFAMAQEASLSRVWAGVHFPCDTWEGRKLGITIGNEIFLILRNRL